MSCSTRCAVSLTATRGVGQVVLNWTASTGASSYDVRRALSAAAPTHQSSRRRCRHRQHLHDTVVTNDTTYYYVVTARNGAAMRASPAIRAGSATPRSCQAVLDGSVISVTLKATPTVSLMRRGTALPVVQQFRPSGSRNTGQWPIGEQSCGVALRPQERRLHLQHRGFDRCHTWDVVFWWNPNPTSNCAP